MSSHFLADREAFKRRDWVLVPGSRMTNVGANLCQVDSHGATTRLHPEDRHTDFECIGANWLARTFRESSNISKEPLSLNQLSSIPSFLGGYFTVSKSRKARVSHLIPTFTVYSDQTKTKRCNRSKVDGRCCPLMQFSPPPGFTSYSRARCSALRRRRLSAASRASPTSGSF